MKRRTLIAALILLLPAAAGAQESAPAAESTRETELKTRVDALFAEWDRPDSPGCALAVVHNGQLVYQHGYGCANLDYQLPITPDSVFYLASVSKQFTAAAIILLAQEGKLSLDDDVHKYVPELPDYGATITLRHLAHHTSGLRDYLTLMQLAGLRWEDVHGDDELIDLVCRQKALNFAPGDQHLYSNTGYLLLAEIVRRVSGKSLRQYAEQKIFKPLGMTSTHFHDDRTEIVANRVTGYRKNDDGTFRVHFPANWDKVGSGGLYSSVADLARWDQNFYDPVVGGPELIETLQTRDTLNDGTTLDYAFGLVHGEYKGLKTVSHGGSFQGFRTVLLRFPEERFSVILLANLAEINPTELARRVADVYLAERFASAPAVYEGTYRSDELQATYTIELRDGDLILDRPGAEVEPLKSTGKPGTYSAGELELVFTRNGRGEASGFSVTTGRARNARFERIEKSDTP